MRVVVAAGLAALTAPFARSARAAEPGPNDKVRLGLVGCGGMDGYVAIGGCDKNMPGAMICIARMNRPAVFVYGGTILPGCLTAATTPANSPNVGKDLDVVSVFEAIGQHAAGKISDAPTCPGM